MDYFAGLDISMDETYVCVLDREGAVVRESNAVGFVQLRSEFFSRLDCPQRSLSGCCAPLRPLTLFGRF